MRVQGEGRGRMRSKGTADLIPALDIKGKRKMLLTERANQIHSSGLKF